VQERKGRGRREDTEGDRGEERKQPPGPSPTTIIIAVAILVIIIGVAAYFIFREPDVESIVVMNIDEDSDTINFNVRATAGFGDYSGDADIEIIYLGGGEELTVYEGSVSLNDGQGYMEVPYGDFVWGNGDYRVVARADGKEGTQTYNMRRVVTSLYIEWQGVNSDLQLASPDYQVEVNVTYLFDGQKVPAKQFPTGYDFTGSIERPAGGAVSISSSEFSSNLLKLQKRVDHTVKGEYKISGTLTNTFCKQGSPFRSVSISSNDTYGFDAYPFAVAGENKAGTLVDGEATISFDASGSWDDGTISSYIWDWDGDGIFDETTSNPAVDHTYTSTGTFYVTLKIKDDKGQESVRQSGAKNTLTVIIS
jgi:hypothetical protein